MVHAHLCQGVTPPQDRCGIGPPRPPRPPLAWLGLGVGVGVGGQEELTLALPLTRLGRLSPISHLRQAVARPASPVAATTAPARRLLTAACGRAATPVDR